MFVIDWLVGELKALELEADESKREIEQAKAAGEQEGASVVIEMIKKRYEDRVASRRLNYPSVRR